MDAQNRRDWLKEGQRHDITCACETALHAAAGMTWQRLGWIAAGGTSTIGRDYLDATRVIVAEYLRHTGRLDEAIEVLAVGCNEPPPPTVFGHVDPAQAASLRNVLKDL